QRLDLDRVHVFRRHQFKLDTSRNDVAVLLSTSGDALPLAVERSLGRGRVVMLGVPFDLAWSNLPACQTFVVMANEWLWYLVDPAMTPRNLRAGEAFVWSDPGDAKSAKLTKPDGE